MKVANCVKGYIPVKELFLIEGKDPITHLKVNVFYNKGGITFNLFSKEVIERGYYVSVSPISVLENGNVFLELCNLGSGCRTFIKRAARFSAKQMDLIWGNVVWDLKNKKGGTMDIVNSICKEFSVEITGEFV